jgi:23S rRNA pseudouridine1911/1915/1917 synthase
MKPLSNHQIQLEGTVPVNAIGLRVDQVAADLFPEFSRSQLQNWIKAGDLTVDGRQCRPKDKVLGGETLIVDTLLEPQGAWISQQIDLDVLHQDREILVINKPVGLVVHPGAGNPDTTLLNALLYHFPDQELIPRAGIVHRLDKDTSGLMVVARTLEAQASLVNQLQARSVSREYEAVVQGVPISGGTVTDPIGRHPRARTKMAVVARGGKPAVTHYRVIARFAHHARLRVALETGRTHQIRVHMAHLGFPLVGDPLYGGRPRLPPGADESLLQGLKEFKRQALHAAQLSLDHPGTGDRMTWQAPLPEDLAGLLELLAQ